MRNTLFIFDNQARDARYVAYRLLGSGGSGDVWAGFQNDVLPIAIKVKKASTDAARDLQAWYKEQWVHLQCIHHPHIVQTYDQFSTNAGLLVLIMELAEGDLQTAIYKGVRYSPKDVCAVALQLLSALSYIHGLPVYHRDVTPKNILLFNNGRTFKLGDFSASRINLQRGELAKTMIGQKGYYPHELLGAGQFSCAQSDIYQLGVVLLTLLNGLPPIPQHATLEEAKRLTLEAAPRRLAESLIKKYGRTAEIIAKMLPRTLAYRYATAMQAWADFDAQYKALVDAENTASAKVKNATIALGTIGALYALSTLTTK